MNEELRVYLKKVFAGAPETPANTALFEEMLGNLSDRCRELTAKGMDSEIAVKTAIDEIGDIGPLIDRGTDASSHSKGSSASSYKQEAPDSACPQESSAAPGAKQAPPAKGRKIYPPEKLRRMKILRGAGVGGAVALFILSVVPALFGDLLALLLFPIVGLGVVLLILTRKGGYTDNSAFSYSPEQISKDSGRANCLLALGIFFCIISVVPPAVINSNIGVALFFLSVALGVFAIVFESFFRPQAAKGVTDGVAGTEPSHSTPAPKKRHCTGLIIALCLIVAIGGFVTVLALNDYECAFYYSGSSGVRLDHTGNGSVTDPVTRLVIDWRRGAVEVLPAPAGMTEITLVGTWMDGTPLPEDDSIYWGLQNGRLVIHDNAERVLFHFGKIKEKKLTVYFPEEKNTLSNASLETASAGISVTGIIVQDTLEAESASGNVDLSGVRLEKSGEAPAGYAQKLKVSTASGNITLRQVSASELKIGTASGTIVATEGIVCRYYDASSASGDIFFRGEVESINADTASGNLPLTPVGTYRKIEVDTASGTVTLCLSESETGFTMELDTGSGHLHTGEFAVALQNNRYVYGDGAASIEIDTASGDILLTNK